jgi:hypothetical protein
MQSASKAQQFRLQQPWPYWVWLDSRVADVADSL